MAIYPPNQTTPKKGSDGYLWNWLGSPLRKFAQAIQPYISGGGGGITEVTYTELQTLITAGTLVPGVTYKITGFNKNMPSGGPGNINGYLPEVLYDDGTNSGITIYIQAISTTEMATSGYGEFYNPNYYDGASYTNTDGTGLYGIWDGNNPDPLQVPAYQVGDVVFWGGYAWENTSGAPGNAMDIVTLSAIDWVKLPYSNTTWYTKVTDEIKVDWNNGIIVERYNPENQIRVAYNGDQYSWWTGYYTAQVSPISVMAWGLYSKVTPEGIDADFYGISNLEVINSWMETVNFKGEGLLNVYMDTSGFYSNYIGIYVYIDEIELTGFSTIRNNDIYNYGGLTSLQMFSSHISGTISNESSIYESRFDDSILSSNTMSSASGIFSNVLTTSVIQTNVLDNNSTISNNTLSAASIIEANSLDNASMISSNTLVNSTIGTGVGSNVLNTGCRISGNMLHTNCSINGVTLSQNSEISDNQIFNNFNIFNLVFSNLSKISGCLLNNGYIAFGTLDGTVFYRLNFLSGAFDLTATGTLTNKNISTLSIYDSSISVNISLATILYGQGQKTITLRQDGTKVMSYIDNTNNFIITTTINA